MSDPTCDVLTAVTIARRVSPPPSGAPPGLHMVEEMPRVRGIDVPSERSHPRSVAFRSFRMEVALRGG